MGGYIGATAVGLTTTAADVQGDITSTDTTPELILKNTTETDADGSRDGKITFKGEQSGGEESTLAQIQSSHDGTADDQKGDLIFKTNDGFDGASPTERFRIDSLGRGSFGTGTSGVPSGFWNGASYEPYFAIENNGINAASNYVTLGLLRHTADSEAAQLGFAASRGTTTNSKTIVQSGDSLGTITFQGADGSEYCEGGRITVAVDGTPGSNDMPSRMQFYTTADGAQTPTERMRIDSSGNVGIGATNPLYPLYVDRGATGDIAHFEGQGSVHLRIGESSNNMYLNANNGNATLAFQTNGGERMRMDSAGSLLHGKTTDNDFTGGAMVTYETSESGGRFTATTNGSTGGAAFLANSTSGNVALIRCDGDLENINNRYTGFSDERLKENIVDSNSQWDDVKSVRVRKFSWKSDELDAPNKLGVIAQELEALGMSSLVNTNPDLNDPTQERKSVAYSILYMKAFKALQEAMDRIETLETKVAALEGA